MIKISFLGDIMCEGPFLRAADTGQGGYDFSGAFDGLKDFLSESDYVIGNLETPAAGQSHEYTRETDLYSFNTPAAFIREVKNAGVDLALTANNHCFDRGEEGLLATLEALDACGLAHTGTYPEKGEKVFTKTIEDITFSIISCTSSTNAEMTGEKATLKNVNLLNRQRGKEQKTNRNPMTAGKQFIINDVIGLRRYMKIRKMLGRSPLNPTSDDSFLHSEADRYIDRIIRMIESSAKGSDYVFVCPHMGGQFNVKPGKFSEYVMEKFSLTNVDGVIASHPHILQKIQVNNGKQCFYSIGNVSMSLNTEYIIRENRPDLGLIVNAYLEKGKPARYTCTIIKEMEDENGFIGTYLLNDLIRDASGEEKEQLIRDYRQAVKLLQIQCDTVGKHLSEGNAFPAEIAI